MLGYTIWAAVRQTAARAGLLCEKTAYAVTGGKHPKALFSNRAKPEHVDTSVRIVSQDEKSTTIAKYDRNGNICDEDFVILSTTDFHYDEDTEKNAKTTELFVRQIKETKPDLVVLTGDIILSKYQQVDAIKFAQMMEKIGVYWTAVFGNHEVREERGFYKYLLLKSFSDYSHCLCKFGPEEMFGYGNYTVNIMGSGNRLRQVLFMFDSGRDIPDRIKAEYDIPTDRGGYDFLKKEQIKFYCDEIDRLEKIYGKFHSMMYMHIPLCEYAEIFEGSEKDGYIPSGKGELLYGEQHESVGCSSYNSGMFNAILDKGSTKAVFAGHDHVNDWCALYKGVYLTYSLSGGYDGYDLGDKEGLPEDKWVQGVTLTTIGPDGMPEIRPSYNRKYLVDEDK